MLRVFGIVLLVWGSLSLAQAQGEVRWRVQTAGEAPVLVAAILPSSVATEAVRLLLLPERREVPCDVRLLEGGRREVVWVHPGGRREYLVVPGGRPSTPARWATQLQANALHITRDNELVTRYVFAGAAKPYLYPIRATNGVAMTRAYPLEPREGDSTDHPHQKSFWFTHGDVNGVDFWTEGEGRGRIVHRSFSDISGGRAGIFLVTRNEWRNPQGEIVCTDVREIKVYDIGDARFVDFTVSVHAGDRPLRFGDTKEGTFGIRVPTSMELRRGKGSILTAAGKRDREAWGTRAVWCMYSGEVEGKEGSIIVFDHPSNPHHPTYWHVRDYGLFSANPFGWRDFQNNPNVDGSITVPAQSQLTFRYRVIFTPGKPSAQDVEEWYRAFASEPNVQVVR